MASSFGKEIGDAYVLGLQRTIGMIGLGSRSSAVEKPSQRSQDGVEHRYMVTSFFTPYSGVISDVTLRLQKTGPTHNSAYKFAQAD